MLRSELWSNDSIGNALFLQHLLELGQLQRPVFGSAPQNGGIQVNSQGSQIIGKMRKQQHVEWNGETQERRIRGASRSVAAKLCV